MPKFDGTDSPEVRDAYLVALATTYGVDIETLREIDRDAGKYHGGGNVWPNGMD